MSDQPTIHEALRAVMLEVTEIPKGSRNSFYNFAFRGVEEVMNKVGPALRKHGIVPLPELLKLESRDVITKKGDTNREVTVTVRYTFMGPAMDSYSIVVPGEAQDAGGSGVSKAMSVAQRIGYLQALAIPVKGADPESSALERGTPALTLKQEIWNEGKKRGWVLEDNTYMQLADHFAEWAHGTAQIETANEEALEEYRDHLKPQRKMSRAQRPAGDGS